MIVGANYSPLHTNIREVQVSNLERGSNVRDFPRIVTLPRLEHHRFLSDPFDPFDDICSEILTAS